MNYTCNDCRLDYEIELMTKHHKHLCKKCGAERMKKWRASNQERAKQINLKSHLKNSDKIKSRRRIHYLSGKESRHENYAEVNREWKVNNREKVNAKAAVERAIKKGVLTRPTNCSYCGSDVCIVAHHPDYTKRLEVVWICQSCHRRLHSKHHHAIQDHIKR